MKRTKPPVIIEQDKSVMNGHCDCGVAGEPEHERPYNQEIGDGQRICNCCDNCRHQCAMDI